MKKLKELLEKPWFAYTVATCSAVLLFVLLTHLGMIFGWILDFLKFFNTIVVGLVIAYLINPIAEFFEKKLFQPGKKIQALTSKTERTENEDRRIEQSEKLRHTLSVAVALILVVALITLLFVALIPSLGESIAVIASNMDSYISNAQKYIDDITRYAARFHINMSGLSTSLSGSVSSFLSTLPQKLATVLSTSYSVGVGIGNLVIGMILAVYFLLGKKHLLKGFDRLRRALLSDESYESHGNFWSRCHEILLRYIGFDLLDGIIVGCVNAIFMLAFRMPYVALISVIVGVTNLLPTFGPIAGAALGGFILVLTDPIMALAFLIFTVVLQIVDGYVLKPRLFGEAMGVPPVWTLISIIMGGKFFGLVGILLAIPAAAVVSFIYEDWIYPWMKQQKVKRESKRKANGE